MKLQDLCKNQLGKIDRAIMRMERKKKRILSDTIHDYEENGWQHFSVKIYDSYFINAEICNYLFAPEVDLSPLKENKDLKAKKLEHFVDNIVEQFLSSIGEENYIELDSVF